MPFSDSELRIGQIEIKIKEMEARLAAIPAELLPGGTEHAARTLAIETIGRQGGVIALTKLNRRLFKTGLKSKQVKKILENMSKDGLIEISLEKTTGRPITKIRLTNPG